MPVPAVILGEGADGQQARRLVVEAHPDQVLHAELQGVALVVQDLEGEGGHLATEPGLGLALGDQRGQVGLQRRRQLQAGAVATEPG